MIYTFQDTEFAPIDTLSDKVCTETYHDLGTLYGDTTKVIGYELHIVKNKKMTQALAEIGSILFYVGTSFKSGMRVALMNKPRHQALKKYYPELFRNYLNSLGCKFKNFPQVQHFLLGIGKEQTQEFKTMFCEIKSTEKVTGSKKLEDGSIVAESPDELLRAILGDL